MPFEAFSFDDSVGRTEQGRARVPEGYYLVECEGFEPTPEDYAKTTGIWVKVRIVAGPDSAPGLGVGGRLRDFNSVGKVDAQFGLGQALGAFGQAGVAKQLAATKLRVDSYQQLQNLCANFTRVVGTAQAVADIRDQVGQTRPFSGIENLLPASEWTHLKTATAYTDPNGPVDPGSGMGARPAPRNGPSGGGAEIDLFADLDRATG